MSNDHITRAKDYIAIAESTDSKREAYSRAADEIIAWLAEDPARTQTQAAELVGRGSPWVSKLLRARKSGEEIDWGSGSNKRDDVAHAALVDVGRRAQVLSSLSRAEKEALIHDAHRSVMDDIHAVRAEHATEPTTRELMGDDKFDPAADWADTLVVRVNRNAHELAGHVEHKAFVLGAMSAEKAFDYLCEAERLIADVRALVGEMLADEKLRVA